jgi:hypothetical protein
MSLARHCWKCGTEYRLSGSPGRSETCEHCNADLKVCLNCVSYDLRAAYQCRDRRAEAVEEKGAANYCEYFEMARREFVSKEDAFGKTQASQARENLKKLFGD